MRFLCPGNSPIGNSERLLGQVVAGLSGLCISHVFSFAALAAIGYREPVPAASAFLALAGCNSQRATLKASMCIEAVEAKAAWLSCSFVSAHALDPWTHIRYTPVHPAPALIGIPWNSRCELDHFTPIAWCN